MLKKVTLRECLIALAVFMIAMFFMRSSIERLETISNGYGIIDLTSGWTKTEITDHFISLGIEGRQYYRNSFYIIDFVYPFLYALFYSITLSYLIMKPTEKRGFRFLIYIPIIALTLDLSENLLVISMLSAFTSISNLQVALFNFSNIGKFICVYLSLIAIVAFGTFRIVNKIRSRSVLKL